MRLVILTIAAVGCGSDIGEPPSISNLSISSDRVTVGQPTTITGSVDVTDPDGDLAEVGIDLVDPDGVAQTIGAALAGAGGLTAGSLPLAVLLQTSKIGTYSFELFVIDAEDNESNRLAGALESVE